MDLVIIFGPQAVGKTAVGRQLEKITSLKLFHNHQTIDLLTQYFEFGSSSFNELCWLFRSKIIEAAAKDKVSLIFTMVWALQNPGDKIFIDEIAELYEKEGGRVSFVELESPLAVRQVRNHSEERQGWKPGLAVKVENVMKEWEQIHKLNSNGDFFYPERHIKINNQNLSPVEAAEIIKNRFQLK
jgi:hypothetical protein